MDVVPDEVAVRRLFDEMTTGQPDPPPDRQRRIRRRALRQRLAKAAGTVAVIAGATALAVGIGTSAHRVAPDTGPRSVPTWALPWPDHRNGSVPQRVLDGAVASWRSHATSHFPFPASTPANSTVIWYVGQTVVRGQVVVVVFEADTGLGKRLVAGWAMASAVMHSRPGSVSRAWVFYDVPAPKPSAGLFIGLNVHGTSARQGRNPDNWIVVLAAPDVQGVGFTVAGPSSTKTTDQGTTSSSTEMVGIAPAVRGLAIGDVGQITSPVQVTSLNVGSRNTLTSPADVSVPGSAASQVPELAAPGPVRGRPGFARVTEFTGQGATASDLTGVSGQLAIRARCTGPGPVRILFGHGAARDLLGLPPGEARTRLTSLGSIACDDGAHELVTSVRLPSRHNRGVVVVSGQPTAVYRVDLGTAAKR